MAERRPLVVVSGQVRELPAGDSPVGRGCTLLATITPTAAAAVDALTVFSSDFDNYLVIGAGILPSAADYLVVRCANAGTVDAGTVYSRNTGFPTAVAFTSTSMQVSDNNITVLAAGRGLNFSFHFVNANSTSGLKSIHGQELHQSGVTPQAYPQIFWGGYSAANAVSGLRFLWNNGANFAAAGKIRIYGYNG